ncbi:GYD domain-containing protein [Falsiroseomonas oryzae]|uniref:GYD domain-containing protein n=1 Tax=Falsiroseomonas oryzae TaxID=2766473 RepID=UPI0022EACB48|nr:GYD domain-containing protein [Roseomonas sp. MO-31]
MPHYMLRWSFKDTTIKALTENPQDREQAARQVIESFGGRLLCYYLSLGEHDGFCVAEFPDTTSVAAASMRVTGSGAFSRFETVALLTMAEARQAMQKVKDTGTGNYSPPGERMPGN